MLGASARGDSNGRRFSDYPVRTTPDGLQNSLDPDSSLPLRFKGCPCVTNQAVSREEICSLELHVPHKTARVTLKGQWVFRRQTFGASFIWGSWLQAEFWKEHYKEKQMKSSTTDEIKGNFHELKGKAKETAGKVMNSPNLEAEGKDEKHAGQVQKKVGQIEKVIEK
jgi:uncharacterized protein YjbJ (UPF0337 family)